MRSTVVFLALGWLMVGGAGAVSQPVSGSDEVAPLCLPGQLVSRAEDPELQSLTLSLPAGCAAVVIQPDTGEGLTQGSIEAVDAQGRALVREEHLAGLAVDVASPSDKVRGLGLPENDPLVIMVPPSTVRMEIQGQYYDAEGDPQGDGSIRCYDERGRLLLEEADLSLDLFMF